jgi:hypothetical protein
MTNKPEEELVLTVVVKGTNIMGNPLLVATGIAKIGESHYKAHVKTIHIETPITSVATFINLFEGLFDEESPVKRT